MKKLTLIVFLSICLLSANAIADTITVKWDTVIDPGCAGYVVEMTTDNITWSEVFTTGDPAVVTATIENVPGDMPVSFRVSSLNAAGDKFTRLWSGAWYDGTKKPIADPGGAGIQ